MFFECKVRNKNGKLIRVHTAEELEERSRKICLSLISDADVEIIENFDLPTQDEHEIEIGYKDE